MPFSRSLCHRRFWRGFGCLSRCRNTASIVGDGPGGPACRTSLAAGRYSSAKVESQHLPRFEVPGRTNVVSTAQLAIVPTIPPGDAVERFSRLYYVAPPINRRVVEIILVQRRSVAARQKQQGKQRNQCERPALRLFYGARWVAGTGREPRGHRQSGMK